MAYQFNKPTVKPPSEDTLIVEDGITGSVRPRILLLGDSGTGKTYGIRALLKAKKNVLYIDIENKSDEVEALGAKIIRIGKPIKDARSGALRQPTNDEKYDRLQRFKEALARGEFREHNGKPFDVLAIDGLMEQAQVFQRYHVMDHSPESKRGEDNTYGGWLQTGIRSIDFIKELRDAASAAARAFGFPPLGLVATCGEKVMTDKFGNITRFTPMLQGNVTPDLLPYQFSTILRLAAEVEEGSGLARYVAHTVRTDKWLAKVPSGLFEAKIVGPDLAIIYDKLVEYYERGGVDGV